MRRLLLRTVLVPVLALGTVLAPSCSLMKPSTQAVSITTTEPNAEILVDGNLVGTGSTTVNLARNNSHAVMARIDGRTATANIGTKISTTGILDIVGGILLLVPLIGLAGPGFWDLDQTSITLAIPPAS